MHLGIYKDGKTARKSRGYEFKSLVNNRVPYGIDRGHREIDREQNELVEKSMEMKIQRI